MACYCYQQTPPRRLLCPFQDYFQFKISTFSGSFQKLLCVAVFPDRICFSFSNSVFLVVKYSFLLFGY